MNDRIAVANAWRQQRVSVLVRACGQEEADPIDRAMLAVSIPAGQASDTGFSVSDLCFYRDRLIDRADGIEMQVADRAGKLSWMKRKAEALAEKAGRLNEKARRVGGTVSREEFAKVRDEVKTAQADVTGLTAKIAGLTATLDRMTAEADSLRGAAALIGDLADARRGHVTEAIMGVVVAESEAVA